MELFGLFVMVLFLAAMGVGIYFLLTRVVFGYQFASRSARRAIVKLLARGRFDEAFDLGREQVEAKGRGWWSGYRRVSLGLVYHLHGNYAEAGELYRDGFAIMKESRTMIPAAQVLALENVACLHIDQGRPERAVSVCKRIKELLTAWNSDGVASHLLPGQNVIRMKDGLMILPTMAILLSDLADHYRREGRESKADALEKRCKAILHQIVGFEGKLVRS